MSDFSQHEKDLIDACVQMVGRTGANDLQIRYSDDEQPVVWMANARFDEHWEVGAALHPVRALFRLLEQLIDGGRCAHCQRPTGITEDVDAMPLGEQVCWYQFDPELKTFRRGCEGEGK